MLHWYLLVCSENGKVKILQSFHLLRWYQWRNGKVQQNFQLKKKKEEKKEKKAKGVTNTLTKQANRREKKNI